MDEGGRSGTPASSAHVGGASGNGTGVERGGSGRIAADVSASMTVLSHGFGETPSTTPGVTLPDVYSSPGSGRVTSHEARSLSPGPLSARGGALLAAPTRAVIPVSNFDLPLHGRPRQPAVHRPPTQGGGLSVGGGASYGGPTGLPVHRSSHSGSATSAAWRHPTAVQLQVPAAALPYVAVASASSLASSQSRLTRVAHDAVSNSMGFVIVNSVNAASHQSLTVSVSAPHAGDGAVRVDRRQRRDSLGSDDGGRRSAGRERDKEQPRWAPVTPTSTLASTTMGSGALQQPIRLLAQSVSDVEVCVCSHGTLSARDLCVPCARGVAVTSAAVSWGVQDNDADKMSKGNTSADGFHSDASPSPSPTHEGSGGGSAVAKSSSTVLAAGSMATPSLMAGTPSRQVCSLAVVPATAVRTCHAVACPRVLVPRVALVAAACVTRVTANTCATVAVACSRVGRPPSVRRWLVPTLA
jgi:hypothetical protein